MTLWPHCLPQRHPRYTASWVSLFSHSKGWECSRCGSRVGGREAKLPVSLAIRVNYLLFLCTWTLGHRCPNNTSHFSLKTVLLAQVHSPIQTLLYSWCPHWLWKHTGLSHPVFLFNPNCLLPPVKQLTPIPTSQTVTSSRDQGCSVSEHLQDSLSTKISSFSFLSKTAFSNISLCFTP